MRALIVALALVATPFLASVSQNQNGMNCDNGQGDEHRSDSGQVNAHQGLCAPQPPPPPPPPPSCTESQLTGGSATIRGRVELGQSPFTLLEGWCVELRDPVSDVLLATTVSTIAALDGMNNFLFTTVPAGTYKICEVKPAGTTWTQAYPTIGPTCAFGLGFTTPVTAGSDASFNWFGNLP